MSEETQETTEQGSAEQTTERNWNEEATSMGWKPDHDGPDRLDAKEFVLRKPLYDEMKKLRKKTKELETAIRTQENVQAQLRQREKEEMLNSLKQAKIQAIEEGEAAKVVQIDEQMEKIRQQPVQQRSGPPPEFVEWSSDPENSWYGDDEDMAAWADAKGLRLYQANPNRSVSEIYAEISRSVKKAFPHKFENPNREKPSNVESPSNGRPASKQELGMDSIPSEYKQVFHTLYRSGCWGDPEKISKKDAAKIYAKDLAKIGVIGEK